MTKAVLGNYKLNLGTMFYYAPEMVLRKGYNK